MLHARHILKLFELRGRAMSDVALEEGMRVGRGFADVGFEEFIVLPGARMLSLLTGEVSLINQVRREHLFEIATSDQLIAEIHQAGFVFQKLECPEQRGWNGSVVSGEESFSVEGRSLEECLLCLALAVKKIEIPVEVRCLKSVKVSG